MVLFANSQINFDVLHFSRFDREKSNKIIITKGKKVAKINTMSPFLLKGELQKMTLTYY